jgi:NADH-quinone oxidoreductase subunit C
MSDIEIVESLKRDLGEKALEVANPDRRRIFLKVAPAGLVEAATLLRDRYGCAHLSTVSGVDKGETFNSSTIALPAAVVSLRTEVPTAPLASISGVIPGAILYEREIQDMFGIVVDGIPDGRRLVLPDDWPDGQFPLRKDWTFVRPEEVIPGGKS